jgi:PIN domain nuclease of toxin-antitoxin system
VRILLDTHIALWAIVGDPRLPRLARTLIQDGKNSIVVSAASVWEIAIKHAVSRGGPMVMPMSGSEALNEFLAAGYEALAISPAHAAALDSLPSRHRDPFDRILVAQAIAEPLRLLTADARLAEYSDTVILV